MLKNLLLYRLLIFNMLGAAGLYMAWGLGWLEQIWEADASRISSVITVLFLLVLSSSLIQGWKVAKAMNAEKDGMLLYVMDAEKRLLKIAHIDRAAGWMTTLGLIGTVVGFIIAFMSIDMELIGSAEGVQQLAAQLVSGMGTALVTTLVGAIAGLWTEVNFKMIKTVAGSLAV